MCRLVESKSSYPFPRRQILDSSKLKEFAHDNFNFDENGRKLSKQVENTVGKREIARYEQFLLFPQCFQKAFFFRGRNFFKREENTVWYTREKEKFLVTSNFSFSHSAFKRLVLLTRKNQGLFGTKVLKSLLLVILICVFNSFDNRISVIVNKNHPFLFIDIIFHNGFV